MEKVYIEKIDELYVRVVADPSTKMEMSEYFTFFVPGYKFMPAFKNKVWDGKIRLLNTMTGSIYAGLVPYIAKFCETRDYELILDKELKNVEHYDERIGYDLAANYKSAYEPREYQNDAVRHALSSQRALLLSPTASGKSFIIYLLSRYHNEHERRVLIIVPTTSLVSQMAGDFLDYNEKRPLDIHQIMGGVDKNVDSEYTITTWQSVYKQPKSWFEKFDVIIGDEAHLFKAKSLTKIMEKTGHIKYRYGFTGTLDDTQTHKLVLEGLFGSVYQVTETKKLIEDKTLADFNIKAITLQYSEATRKANRGKTYQEEIDWIVKNEARNKLIRNLAWSLPGNTLILFQFVDKHGRVLEPMLQKEGKNVHFIHGGVDASDREAVRRVVDRPDEEKIVLWFGNNEVELDLEEVVMLSNNSYKKASDLTVDDDICEKWLKSYINASRNP